MKIKILQDVNALINGKHRALAVGDVVDADKDEAENLVRGRYAEPLAHATKVTRQPQAAATTRKGRGVKAG